MGVYRMSEEEAKSLGYGHLIPPKVTRASNLDELGRNKLEAKFGRYLDELKHRGDIKGYKFESVKLRLAKRTWYTPDYHAIRSDDAHILYECKGNFWRDDARVKIKVAAEMYPHFRFIAVRWVGKAGGWDFEHFDRRG